VDVCGANEKLAMRPFWEEEEEEEESSTIATTTYRGCCNDYRLSSD